MKLVPQDFSSALRVTATLILFKCTHSCVKRLEEKRFPGSIASNDEINLGKICPFNLDQWPEIP
jgi:hypothetical protein